jgi:toxin ParE1/3/4
MRTRAVAFSEAAQWDLFDLELWLEHEAGKTTARRYIDRLTAYCMKLDLASERGARRDDLLPGLRIVGFERRITVAFVVVAEQVEIVRIFRAGRDWESEFEED